MTSDGDGIIGHVTMKNILLHGYEFKPTKHILHAVKRGYFFNISHSIHSELLDRNTE